MVGWTDKKKRPHGRKLRGLPITPAVRARLMAEGGSGRTEAFVWAREQMVERHPGLFKTAEDVLARLSNDNSRRGEKLRQEFTGLVESWPGPGL